MDRKTEAIALASFTNKLKRDPLAGFRFMSDAQRHLFRLVHENETFWRSGNSGGKTAGGAALGVALARGIEELDGEPLPKLGIPNLGWVITQSYKQQVDASQRAYLKWLGDWPHDVSYIAGKSKGYIETIYVSTSLCRHETGKSCENCSRIVFHCEESDSSIGGRIDWAHGDEPPSESVWREVRGRRSAGRPFIKFITATPLEAHRWQWMQEDFAGCLSYASRNVTGGKIDLIGSPANGRAEIRSTLYDNKALRPEDIQGFLTDFRGDPFFDARVRGDYVDAAGQCPFDVTVLDRWQTRCRDGRMNHVIIQTETDGHDGRLMETISVPVETWHDCEPGEKYLLIADPASGTKSKHHDPGELIVVARKHPKLCARYNGYLSPYGLGNLASILAQRYNKALVDVDMTGGYGGPFLSGLGRYLNINRDTDPDKPGYVNQRLGFRITASNRGEIIGAIQQALSEDGILIESSDVISTLRNVVLVVTKSGASKYEARAGKHDESLITVGRALFLLSTRPMKERLKPLSGRLREALGIRAPRPVAARLAWR